MAAPLGLLLIAGTAYKVAKPLYTALMKKGVGKVISKAPSGKELKTMTKNKASDLLGGSKVTPVSMSQKGVKKVVGNIAKGAGGLGVAAGYLLGKNKDKIDKVVSGKSKATPSERLKKAKPSRKPKRKTPRLSQVENKKGELVLPKTEVDGNVTINWDVLDKKKSGGYVKQYANGGRVAKYNKD